MAVGESETGLVDLPEYEGLEDIRSHIHFCEYLKEFTPNLPEVIAPLRPYLKKGARFENYASDVPAQEARRKLVKMAILQCTISSPDLEAAANPAASGRPFELFVDASGYG